MAGEWGSARNECSRRRSAAGRNSHWFQEKAYRVGKNMSSKIILKSRRLCRVALKRLTLGAVLALAIPSSGADRAAYEAINQKARNAAKKQDWAAMRAALMELRQQMPAPTPLYMLRMASVEARLGNAD